MKETFFLQVTPGLEDIAKLELELKFQSLFPLEKLPVCHMEKGGFSIELDRDKGFSLNYWLKIPNRILLRFAHFKCRDLPKLFNKIKKMDWSPFYAGQKFNIKVSAHSSRLFDDRKIIKSIEDGLQEYIKRQVPSKKASERTSNFSEWNLLCRFEEDWCTLSLDTSGERLGLRGIKTHIGLAPLRENLAAALYLFTLKTNSLGSDHLNPLAPLFLCDPFAGSGTVIQESFLFFEPNNQRDFAFQFFPLTIKIKKIVEKPAALKLGFPFLSLANERNSNQLEGLKKNYEAAEMNLEQNKVSLGDSMSESHLSEVLNPLLKTLGIHESWIITNPPYGKRLKSPGEIKDLLSHFFSLHDWNKIGILLPAKTDLTNQEYKCLGKLNFSHGGEDVIYSLWSR